MITIGITTYNRKEILELSAKSLYQSTLKRICHIRIYDDSSDEFEVKELQQIFPNATTIIRHNQRLGPDRNMLFMYIDFLKSNDEYFFNADGDLIYSQDWLEHGLQLIDQTDGVISLFNTPNHVPIKENGELLEKMAIGAAGAFFRRKIIEMIVKTLLSRTPPPPVHAMTLDWQWSSILRENNIRLMTVKNSLVQHIGINGHWSNKDSFDYGDGFIVDNVCNGQILNDLIVNLSETISAHMRRATENFNVQKYEDAVKEFTKIIMKNPNMAEMYNNRAVAYMKIGKKELAIKDFERANQLQPDNEMFKNNLNMAINQ